MSDLTAAEKVIIKNTWDLVKKDVHGNGYDLFIRFFTENPTYQQHFKAIQDVPLSDLKGNKKLLAHATNVMYAITMLVDNIDDTEVLVEMLQRLSKNHARRKITVEHFERLQITLVGLLKEKLGPTLMNDDAVNAWAKTYGIIVSVVKPGLDNPSDD